MKDTSEIVCQRNSFEAAQQNFVKLCSYEGHWCKCAYPQEILGVMPLFELRNLTKIKDTTQISSLAQLLYNRSTEFRETL